MAFLLSKFNVSKTIVGVELDDFWHDFCLNLNIPNYTGVCADATQVSNWQTYLTAENNLIINTSCEHMNCDWLNFNRTNSNGVIYAQGNNYKIPEHINVSSSLDEFVSAFESHGLIIQKTLEVKFAPYNRYCVVASWK